MLKAVIEGMEDCYFEFPKLMYHMDSGFVVLMKSESKGTIIVPGKTEYKYGQFIDDWDISVLVDFTGELTLSNEPVYGKKPKREDDD